MKLSVIIAFVTFVAFPVVLLASELYEDFEDTDTPFEWTSSNVTYDISSQDESHSGTGSLKVFPSTCPASCFDAYSVTFRYVFPEPVNLVGIEMWGLEDATDGTAWGGKVKVGHDDIWNEAWAIVHNNQPVTGVWEYRYFEIDETATDVLIRVWDMTNQSTVWLDDVVIYFDDSVANDGTTWSAIKGLYR